MDIKRIHDMIETLTECAKHEFDKGVENIDTKEMGEVIDMIKDLAEAEYYRKISVAMDEAEYGEDYDYEGRKGYRGQPRDSRGRYTSRRGRRMGYEEPKMPIYDTDGMNSVEYMRDMDKHMGRMYYGDDTMSANANTSTNNGARDVREGRSGQVRKGYMETKDSHKANTPEDKQIKMRELEKYMNELANDVTEMLNDATQEEKNLLKQKMSTLMSKI